MTPVLPTELWLERFMVVIGATGLTAPDDFTDRFAALATQQPLYVENLRSLLNVRTRQAEEVCDSAVRAGLFTHRTGLLCPNATCGRMLYQSPDNSTPPPSIACEVCEGLEQDEFEFRTSTCPQMDCYYIQDALSGNPRSELPDLSMRADDRPAERANS